MNKENNVIIKLYQQTIILRECLEYALDKHLINKEIHKKRGEFFNKLVSENLVTSLLANNKEAADKIQNQLKEFHQDVFIDNKYFLYENDDFFKTDDAIRVKLLEYIVGLYQTINDIIFNIVKQVKERGNLYPLVEEVITSERDLYVSRASLVLFNEIVRQSNELNKQINEMKKIEESSAKAQLQFLVNELKKTVGFIKFVHEKYRNEKEEIKLLFPLVEETLKRMDGSNKVSSEEIVKSIKLTLSYCSALNQVYERVLNIKYGHLINELKVIDKNLQA